MGTFIVDERLMESFRGGEMENKSMYDPYNYMFIAYFLQKDGNNRITLSVGYKATEKEASKGYLSMTIKEEIKNNEFKSAIINLLKSEKFKIPAEKIGTFEKSPWLLGVGVISAKKYYELAKKLFEYLVERKNEISGQPVPELNLPDIGK